MTSAPVGLREACADRRLLGIDLSPRQGELAALVESCPTVVVAAGRQSGKSLVGAALLVHGLLLRPDLDRVAGGSTRHGLCVANSREQAAIVLGYARRLIEGSPLLRSQLVGARDDRLVLDGGRVLLAMPCSDRHVRGLSASVVVLDELAHFLTETDGPQAADRVFAALRPSLTTFGAEGRLLAISTPLGRSGLFWELHARASSGELPEAAAFTASTAEMNPRVSADFLAGERLMLGPQDFEREYEARFTGGEGQFLEEEAVRAVVGRHRELPAGEGTDWVVGFDPSFAVDPSAAVVVGRGRADHEQLVVARVERWQPARARKRRRQSTAQRQQVVDAVLDGVAALSLAYGANVVTDQHLPATVIEGLRQRGVLRVQVRAWTPQTQTDGFRALRSRIYSGRITLPQDDQLVAELCRLRTKLRAGSSQVEIPRAGGSHCDSAVALAAACLELDRRGAPSPLRTSSALRGLPRQRRPLRDIEALGRELRLPVTSARTAHYTRGDGTSRQVTPDVTWRPWRRSR